MTSPKQIAANRANALKSTGPRTEVGKKIASLNAVRHGGLSPLPVLPDLETLDAWQDHLDGTLASLRAIGHLETVLAERVALLLWRMNRVGRYEREMIAVGQERIVDHVTEQRRRQLSFEKTGPDDPDKLRAESRDAQHALKVIASMYRRGEDDPMSGEDAELVLSAVTDETTEVDPEVFSMPEVVPDEVTWSQFTGWTVERVRRGIEAMAEAEGGGATPDNLLAAAFETARVKAVKLKAETERVQTTMNQMRRERLLAAGPVTDTVTRYEAHLSRQLAQALHELQRLQAARAGGPVSPPVVVDVTVSGSEEG